MADAFEAVEYRRHTPPPWAASDRAAAHADKEHECRDALRLLALDLATLASDWDRYYGVRTGRASPNADALRSVLRRHGLLR